MKATSTTAVPIATAGRIAGRSVCSSRCRKMRPSTVCATSPNASSATVASQARRLRRRSPCDTMTSARPMMRSVVRVTLPR